MSSKVIMAELFGKATGSSKGKGGSMHLFNAEKNFMGGYAMVGGQLPIATGLALASQYKGEERVTLCFLGDGAIQEGEFHESMNLAALANISAPDAGKLTKTARHAASAGNARTVPHWGINEVLALVEGSWLMARPAPGRWRFHRHLWTK